MTASRTRNGTIRVGTVVVVVLVVVLGVLGYRHLVLGEQDGLAELRDSPLLEPSPGSVEIGRYEDPKRPSLGFQEHRGTIQVVSASPKSEREVVDYYISRHGVAESGTGAQTVHQLAPLGGLPGRAAVFVTTRPPWFTKAEIDTSRVPAGTQTFITVEVSQSD